MSIGAPLLRDSNFKLSKAKVCLNADQAENRCSRIVYFAVIKVR